MSILRKHGALIIGLLASIFIISYSSKFPFFWDTIQLGSKHANWYYSHTFSQFFLPDSLDSGHFPVFGMYLSVCWMIFGKTLMVSHFAMLPFLIIIVIYTLKLGRALTDQSFSKYYLVLLFCNPYFLGQSVLVSPDLVLVACFIMCLDSIYNNKKTQLLFACIGLSLISQRGFLIVCILLAWLFIQDFIDSGLQEKNLYKYLLPGVVIALSYQLAHYLAKGWIGYHAASPWSASFTNVDSLWLYARNSGVFIWRLIDFANGFLWIALLVLIARGKGRQSKLTSLLVLLILGFGIVIIPKVGLLNHRYFLPIIMICIFTFLELLYKSSVSYKASWIGLLAILMLSGNFWKYPEGTSQGWDSTLSHVPYYELLEDAVDFIDSNNISVIEIGTAFPAKNKLSDIYLSDRQESFKPFDLDNDRYILYSNVMNDIGTEQLFELDNLWKVIFTKQKGNIVISLFERK